MKKFLGIVVVALIFFGVQSSKVVKADLVEDLLNLSQDQNKRNKFELDKWGLKKKNLVALKSKEIKLLFSGNVLFGDYNDNQKKGRTEETYYEDGRYEGVVLGQKEKSNWYVKNGKLCYKPGSCVKVYKSKTNPNVYFLKAQGMLYTKFFKIISIAELEKQRKEQIEEERIAKEKKAEEERLAKEKKAEEERIAKEKKAEEERIAKEKKAEEERIAEEKKKAYAKKKAKENRKKLNLFSEDEDTDLQKAQILITEIENYVKINPDAFDIVTISEFLIELRPVSEGILNSDLYDILTSLIDFTNKSSSFVEYKKQNKKAKIRSKIEKVDEEIIQLKNYIADFETILKNNIKSKHADVILHRIKTSKNIIDNATEFSQLEEANKSNESLNLFLSDLKKSIVLANDSIEKLKAFLRLNLTSDLAPTILIEVKSLENAISSEDLKTINVANTNAAIFISTNIEKKAEEKIKAEEEKSLAEERKAEEERIAECIEGDCINGYGTYTWADGRQYVGEFKDDKRHGQGTFTYLNGDKYVGEWRDDLFNGQGTYILSDGAKYVGEWKNDKFHGGTFTFASGNKYVGEYKDGKYHGQGTFTWTDGRKYVGEFKEGTQHGLGTFTFANGYIYVGEWKDGKRYGQGTVTNPNGNKYVGGWKNDLRHGKGTLTYADGRVDKKGIWKDGELAEKAKKKKTSSLYSKEANVIKELMETENWTKKQAKCLIKKTKPLVKKEDWNKWLILMLSEDQSTKDLVSANKDDLEILLDVGFKMMAHSSECGVPIG